MEQYYSMSGNKLFPEAPLGCENTKAFLDSFEQEAKAQHWPREEWVTRLMPALGKEAKLAFNRLKARDREDYGRVKATILRWDAMWKEKQRRQFRYFSYPEPEGPREAYHRLRDLCLQWLKIETYTKEQILDLVVLEQFMNILPLRIHLWIAKFAPHSCSAAVALAEAFREVVEERAAGSSQGAQMPSDLMQEQLYVEAKQKDDYEEASFFAGKDWESKEMEALSKIWLPQGPFEDAKENLWNCEVLTWQEENQHEEERDKAIPPENRVFFEHPVQTNKQRDGKNKYLDVHYRNPTEEKPTEPHRETPQRRNLAFRKSSNQSTVFGSLLKTYSRKESPLCRKRFHCEHNLSLNQSTFTWGKAYECSMCRRRFCQKCYLKHQRVHTGDKPLGSSCGGESSCWILSTGEPQSSQIGDDGLYKCSECSKNLGDGSNCEDHKKMNAAEDTK